jgi:1-acyl-sn-glycerol-3-phosphate acyltransferase
MRSFLRKITQNLLGVLAVLVLTLSTLLVFIPIFAFGLLKLIPNKAWRIWCTQVIDVCVTFWIMINNGYLSSFYNIDWQISGLESVKRKGWYLVVANHQSWLDIVVLHRALNRKIPVLKFFIKEQLKWVPLLGFAWWAMGCPFMKRYSRDYIAKNPHKRGKDLAATRKACEQFKYMPVSIMNFVEGTRFTPKKHKQQKSPYSNLLAPKTGGISYVISTMGEQLTSLIDVTIIYPDGKTTLWDFLCHRINKIKVIIRSIPIPEKFIHNNYFDNSNNKAEFKAWLKEQWAQKDLLIQQEG